MDLYVCLGLSMASLLMGCLQKASFEQGDRQKWKNTVGCYCHPSLYLPCSASPHERSQIEMEGKRYKGWIKGKSMKINARNNNIL